MSATNSGAGAETQQDSTTYHTSAAVEKPNPASLGAFNVIDSARNADPIKGGGSEQSKTRILGDEEPDRSSKIHDDTANDTGKISPTPTAAAEMMIASPKPVRPSETRLGEAFDMYKRILKLQHKFFEAHTRLNSERDAIKPRLDRLNETLSYLGDLLGRFADSGCSKSEDTLWSNACVQFRAGRQSFQDQMHVVDDQEQQIDNVLYRLAKLEPEFLQVMNEYFKDEEHLQARPSPPSSLRSRSSSRTLDPLEQQYYDKRDDVRALKERLIDRRAHFQVPSDMRPTTTASSTADQYVQSAAFQKWENEHEGILEELLAAEEQLATLWRQCQDANFDVGMLETESPGAAEPSLLSRTVGQREAEPTQPDIPPFLPQDRHGVLPDFLQDIDWGKQRERIVPYIEEVTKLTGKREFIEDWVNRLKAEPPEAVEFEHSVSPLKSQPEWNYVRRAADDKAIADDYVLVSKQSRNALNGTPEGFVKRFVRRVRSDGALNAVLGTFRSLPVEDGADSIGVQSRTSR